MGSKNSKSISRKWFVAQCPTCLPYTSQILVHYFRIDPGNVFFTHRSRILTVNEIRSV